MEQEGNGKHIQILNAFLEQLPVTLISKGWDMAERHCSTQISLIRSNDEAKTETL